jgi:hypothetical protein
MAFGFLYPRFSESRTIHLLQEELYPIVTSALDNLGWPYKLLWGKEFQAQVPMTNWSWRHEVKVRILTGGIIQAESHSTYREVFFDFGRNQGNISKFFTQIEQIVERRLRDNS